MRIAAAALVLIAMTAVTAAIPSDAAGQLKPYVGVTGSVGTIAQPYAGCDDSSFNITTLAGHVGIERGPLSLQLGYGRSAERRACLAYQLSDPFVAESGIFEYQRYARAHQTRVRVATARLGYSPPFASYLTAYGGGGWETAENDPLTLVGLALGTGRGLRLTGGAELMYLRARHQRIEQEWQDWRRVRETVLEEEHRWRSSVALWAGIELQLARGGR